MTDKIFFFSSLSLWILIGITVSYVILRIKKYKNFITFFIINILIGIVISFLWFFEIAIDGISQVVGVFIYLGVSLVLTVGQYLIIKLLK